MRCWLCDVEPDHVIDATTYSDPEPVYLPGRWPDGDHEHAVQPPSPAELEQAGHETLMRIRRTASDVRMTA